MKIHANRTDPAAYPLFLVYPLLGKRAFLVTIWRRRFEVRW